MFYHKTSTLWPFSSRMRGFKPSIPLVIILKGCLDGEKMRERERKMRENHTRGKAESFDANSIDWWID